MIVFVTTADTEILALSRVARDLPAGFPPLKAVNPVRLPPDLAPETLAAEAAMVLVRLLGGRRDTVHGKNVMGLKPPRATVNFQTFFEPIRGRAQDLAGPLYAEMPWRPVVEHERLALEPQVEIVHIAAIGVGAGFDVVGGRVHPNGDKGRMGVLMPIRQRIGHTHAQGQTVPNGFPRAHNFLQEGTGTGHRDLCALPLEMPDEKVQLLQWDTDLVVIMHGIELKGLRLTRVNEQGAGGPSTPGVIQHHLPVGRLFELGEHLTALPYP